MPAAAEAAEALEATLVDMRWVKPMDEARVLELAESHELLVTVEENAVAGGAGAGVGELLSQASISTPLMMLGIPNDFIEHGEHSAQLSALGLDAPGITASIMTRLEATMSHPSSLEKDTPALATVIPAKAGIQSP